MVCYELMCYEGGMLWSGDLVCYEHIRYVRGLLWTGLVRTNGSVMIVVYYKRVCYERGLFRVVSVMNRSVLKGNPMQQYAKRRMCFEETEVNVVENGH